MFDRITFDSNIMGGRACIRGMRIPVSVLVGQIAHGAAWDEVLQGYPDLQQADIKQALEYAAWLTRQPCSVFQCLLDIRLLEIGVALQHFVPSGSVGDLADEDRHWNSHATDACPAAHDVGVKGNTVKHGSFLATGLASEVHQNVAATRLPGYASSSLLIHS